MLFFQDAEQPGYISSIGYFDLFEGRFEKLDDISSHYYKSRDTGGRFNYIMVSKNNTTLWYQFDEQTGGVFPVHQLGDYPDLSKLQVLTMNSGGIATLYREENSVRFSYYGNYDNHRQGFFHYEGEGIFEIHQLSDEEFLVMRRNSQSLGWEQTWADLWIIESSGNPIRLNDEFPEIDAIITEVEVLNERSAIHIKGNLGSESIHWVRMRSGDYIQPEKPDTIRAVFIADDQSKLYIQRVGILDSIMDVSAEFWYRMSVGSGSQEPWFQRYQGTRSFSLLYSGLVPPWESRNVFHYVDQSRYFFEDNHSLDIYLIQQGAVLPIMNSRQFSTVFTYGIAGQVFYNRDTKRLLVITSESIVDGVDIGAIDFPEGILPFTAHKINTTDWIICGDNGGLWRIIGNTIEALAGIEGRYRILNVGADITGTSTSGDGVIPFRISNNGMGAVTTLPVPISPLVSFAYSENGDAEKVAYFGSRKNSAEGLVLVITSVNFNTGVASEVNEIKINHLFSSNRVKWPLIAANNQITNLKTGEQGSLFGSSPFSLSLRDTISNMYSSTIRTFW